MVEAKHIAHLVDHPHHLEAIALWVFQEWGHLRPGFTLADAEAEFRERMVRDRLPIALVALGDDDAIIGCVSIKESEDLTLPGIGPWIGALYVRADMRGRGIGSALLLRAEEVARSLDCKRLYLSATDAESFYEGFGWTVFERLSLPGEDVVVMARDLNETRDSCA